MNEKLTKDYESLSRYSGFPYYYHKKDKKYYYGLTGWINENTPYVTVKVDFSTTLDSLANKYYGRPDYFWIIADFNRITDCFDNLYEYFKEIKIPSLTQISYED